MKLGHEEMAIFKTEESDAKTMKFLRTRKRRDLLQKGEARQVLLKYAHSFRILGNVHVQINKRLSAS